MLLLLSSLHTVSNNRSVFYKVTTKKLVAHFLDYLVVCLHNYITTTVVSPYFKLRKISIAARKEPYLCS